MNAISGHKDVMTLTICICTMSRPATLKRCLESIYAGSVIPAAVIVSDDSTDETVNQEIRSLFPLVSFVEGPRRGLCANRNHVIRYAETDYVSLLDDDAVVGDQFVAQVVALLPKLADREIVTGDLIETDTLVTLKNASFWGYFTGDPSRRNETIHLNSNAFPRKAFEEVQFDEDIAYGYEDMDVCSHLLSLGYRIRHEPSLVNRHLPPKMDAPTFRARERLQERARFYTSVKRYFKWERNWIKGIAYLLLAPLHRAAHDVKVRNFRDIIYCVPDAIFAVHGLLLIGD
jgi:glycosyltransferase involved in cell wall biosynthesis